MGRWLVWTGIAATVAGLILVIAAQRAAKSGAPKTYEGEATK